MMMHRTSWGGETKVDKKGPPEFKSPQPSYKTRAAGEAPGQWDRWQPSKARSRTSGFSPDASRDLLCSVTEGCGTYREEDKAKMSRL